MTVRGPGEPPDDRPVGASDEVLAEHVVRHAEEHDAPPLLGPVEFGYFGLAVYCRRCGKPVLWKVGDRPTDGLVPLRLDEWAEEF